MASLTEAHPLQKELDELVAHDPQMWRFLQQGSLDGVWYWNLEAPDEEWMSPEFWRLFGIDPATKRHDPAEWQDIIFQEDLAVALENFQRHCADPTHPYDQIVRYRHADGSTVWVRCRGLAIRDDTGKPIRMLGAHNDLTMVKRAEALAQREQVRLEAANADLRSFVYGVSHDLKAPARTAAALVEEALQDVEHLTELQKDCLVDAGTTLKRMLDLVDDLLDYGAIVEQSTAFQTIDLASISEQIESDLRTVVQASGAELSFGPMPKTKGDPSQIRMLLQNLVENAIKFRKPGTPPKVRVTADTLPSGRIALSIQDNGIGIDDAFGDKVFNIFTRFHSKSEFPGSGLGLALCRRIASNHHGAISYKNAPDGGTIFTVDLPGFR